MTAGIYAIVAPSGKRYVGKAAVIELRFEWHRTRLMQGKHPCVALQHDWNSSKPNNLDQWEWLVLDVPLSPSKIVLSTLEKFYVNNSPLGTYNTQLVKKG